ncbi:MAG: CCA tRNA nucleotidyltransferase, partial [Planctomycetota bacterium]
MNNSVLCKSAAGRESLRVIEVLKGAGHIAYLAGGCVRDSLLGKKPKDFDVATDAVPDQVREIFGRRHTLPIGAAFGVIAVVAKQPSREYLITEVATFRSDGDYADGRRPDSVRFGNPEADAMRRDFTINGLFYDPEIQQVIDFVGGLEDLEQKQIRTIRSADDRFGEDRLRMLRAVRFAATLGYRIDDATLDAIATHAPAITVVSGERIGAELRRLFCAANPRQGLQAMIQTDLYRHVLPLADASRMDWFCGFRHPEGPGDFIDELAAWLAGNPEWRKELPDLVDRWRLSNQEADHAQFAMEHADTVIAAGKLPWSQVQPVVIDKRIHRSVHHAERIIANSKIDIPQDGPAKVLDALTWPRDRLDPPPLIDGGDLQQMGYKPG